MRTILRTKTNRDRDLGENMKRKIIRSFAMLLFTTAVFFIACGPDAFKPDLSDTPTSGNLNVSVDESFEPLMRAQSETFMALYKNAKINMRYKTETEAINDLMNDSCKVVVVGHELTDEQNKYFEEKKVLSKTVKIAVDAIGLIINNANPDSLLTYSQVKSMLTGDINDWNKISPTNLIGEIKIVFDKAGSSNARYLNDKFLQGKAFQANCFALKSNKEVIDYVSANKNAVGIIGVSWISDSDDTTAMSFLHQVKVVAVKNEESSEFTDYYKPYQAYIALKQYPLTRDVFLINRQSRNGLGTGFASFVAGDQGQRLVRIKGLLPATMPVRIIKTN